MAKKLTLSHDAILDSAQQKQVLKFIAAITLLIFVPLGIKNILIGEIMLGAVLLAFEISLLLEVTALIYNDSRVFGYLVPLSLLIISIIMAIHVFGTLASYWVFPIVIAIVFLISQQAATISNAIIISGVSIALYPYQEPEIIARYSFSLIVTVVIVHVVVREVRKLQAELRHLSERDALTGALNRHQLHPSLEDAIKHYSHSTIVMIDIDHFKSINDQYGHDVGDLVINQAVRLIDNNTRGNDLLFRLGGDEFLILFNGLDQYAVESIVNLINKNIREQEYPFNAKVTLSCGIAESKPFESSHEWIKRADLALYQSKMLGRNRVSLYSEASFSQLEDIKRELTSGSNIS
jgi:diguanylate cyclase (GGDEF)-like protein